MNAGPLFIPVYNVNSLRASGLGSNINEPGKKTRIFWRCTLGYENLHSVYTVLIRTDIGSGLSKDNRYIPYYDIDGSVVLSEISLR